MIVRIPFNRRIILLAFVMALVGLSMFMKMGPWFFVGTFAFFVVIITYSGLMIGKHSERKPADKTYRPFISIFIPAHDEEEVIAEAVIQALKIRYHKKGRPNYEVWVIDDRSTDATPAILATIKKRNPRLKILSRKPDAFPGKSAAMNQCLPKAKGEVILVIDADAHFAPDIITKAIGYLAPADIGGAQVAKRIANPETNWLCRRQSDEYKIDISIQQGRDSVGGTVEFKGNGSFIKRSVLEEIGGWSRYTITEDLDLSTRMTVAGYHIRFVSEVSVWEQAAPDLRSFSRMRLRWIEGSMLRYLILLPKIIKGPLHPRQRFDMVLFLAEFAIPLFVLFDMLSQVVWIFSLGYLRLGNLAILVAAAIGFLIIKLTTEFIRERRYNVFQITGRTLVTVVYMLHWFPLVIAATFNLIFGFEARSWKKARRVKTHEVVNSH